MSKQFSPISTLTDTYYVLVGRVNDLVSFANNTVSLLSTSSGDMSVGNGFVTGILGANTLTASVIRGGNVNSVGVLNFGTNTSIGNSSVKIYTTRNDIEQTYASNVVTTSTSAQILDSFAVSDFRSAKYLITMTNTDNAGYHQTTEIMLLQDGTNVYMTEYATLSSATTLGVLNANIASGSVRLYITPSYNNNNIKFQRTLLVV
jgi:hypothetical protein